MPVSRANPPAGHPVPPSSISIGKKPMSYPPAQAPAPAPPQQPKSARAASKAPVYNQQQGQQQQPPPQNHRHPSPPTSTAGGAAKGRPAAASAGSQAAGSAGPTAAQKGKASANKIWSTSTTEERERIKDFWLGLGEQERRNLVKIEKDTVLKKMKEQQKHSCSCAVCGRKRNAIEEELEVLYDAYYEELEQYANYQQRYVSSGGTIPPPPGPGPFPGSVELDKNGAVVASAHAHPKRARAAKQQHQVPHRGPPPQALLPPVANGRKQQHPHPHPHHHPPPGKESDLEDEEPEEEEYDGDQYEDQDEEEEEGAEEEEEEEEGEEEEEEEEEEEDMDQPDPTGRRMAGERTPKGQVLDPNRRAPPQANGRRSTPSKGRDGLFNIGNSLTVTGPGNILTVADDLLKNDGQKFLEMMEQLAERRMQREEEAANDVEDESDEESDEDREGSDADEDGEDDGGGSEDEDEDEEDDEEEPMTEEQKMEEGKRMFSIFAARMFEQRVLTAYREKVAQERQLQLLRELDEEDKSTRDREMKKQTQNQKKKDKKRQQKLAKEEEKAAKSAEKAAEEAALKAKQIAQEEENRKRREDERQRREATKRLAEEERLRKEEEKKKRQQEERERELEREKKKREKEERVKKEREEKERKAKEEREARLAKEREERAEKERIEKEKREERERVEKEKRLVKEKEEKAEREAKEKLAAQQRAAAIAQAQANSVKVPVRANASASSSAPSLVSPIKASSVPPVAATASLPRTPNPMTVVTNGAPAIAKKAINNKHVAPTPSVISPSGVVGQLPRPHPLPQNPQQLQAQQPPQQQQQQQPNMSRPHHLPPLSNIGQQHLPPHMPPQMYGHPQGPVMIPPPALSPRVGTFPPMQYPFNSPNMQHHQHLPPGTPLPPSGLSRSFNAGPSSFDPNFARGMPMSIGVPPGGSAVNIPSAAPSPIGPPKPKTPLVPSSTPAPAMLAPGQGRRGSMALVNPQADSPVSGLGPITRPIAPIARPIAGGSGEGASSGSGSPSRRSPSPKGILGSSALAADDDEVVSTAGQRRVAPIGAGVGAIGGGMAPLQNWAPPTSPRAGQPAPWGASGPPGFSPSPARPIPAPIGTNNHMHGMHHPGVSPIGSGSLWANNSPATNGDSWHPQGFFAGPPFMNHNAAASSTPHTGS